MKALGRPAKVSGPIGEIPTEEEALITLVNKKVVEKTLEQYRGRAAQVGRYAYQLRQEVEEQEDQEQLLAPMRKGQFILYLHAALIKDMEDAEGFRSALLHMQLSGEPIKLHTDMFMAATDGSWMASDADVVAAVEGLKYKAGITPELAQKPRGAITITMARELIKWITNRHKQLNTPVRILTFGGLRGHELVLMREGELERTPEAGDWLTINANKRRNAKNAKKVKSTYKKLIIMQECIDAILEAYAAVPAGSGLPIWKYGRLSTGGWNREEMLAEFKAAQIALHWPPELNFVPHSLRHGYDQEVTSIIQAETAHPADKEKRLNDATQQCAATREIYTKENTDRITERAAKQARTEEN